jgi:hypothetical protein
MTLNTLQFTLRNGCQIIIAQPWIGLPNLQIWIPSRTFGLFWIDSCPIANAILKPNYFNLWKKGGITSP